MKREQLSQILKVTLAICVIVTFIFGFTVTTIKERTKLKQEKVKQEAEINGIRIPATYLGKFSISHYCSCHICTNSPKGSRTATGHIPREGRTVAVDPKLIPLHSTIYVEGLGTFVAEDVGGAVKGKHLDIYISDHQKALNLGTLKGATPKVYLLK
jgi:3D (Asp-Asp-Asp) domain-containing protein